MKNLKFLFLTLLSSAVIVSCSDDDDDTPEPINEEEVITTLILEFDAEGSAQDFEVRVTDADGEGPLDPVVSGNLALVAGETYEVEVTVLNELDPTDIEDITEEVDEEDDEHQFFYTFTSGTGVVVDYDDQDDDGNPVGIETIFVVDDNATDGTLVVTLLHEPNKDADGVSDGDPTNANGETDIQATFNYTVQ